jgi:hypothetical protein
MTKEGLDSILIAIEMIDVDRELSGVKIEA